MKSGNNRLMDEERQRYALHAAVFAALSNPTRHELFHRLSEGDRSPSELAGLLGISRPNVSQHLSVLQREGLARRTRRDGRVVWQVVDPRLAQACTLIDEVMSRELRSKADSLERKVPDV
jgi:DNA-binding transcriptional ArsR family regulator